MANNFLTSSMVLAKALDLFTQESVMIDSVYKDYSAEFDSIPKIGESFQIPNPWRFEPVSGAVMQEQEVNMSSVTVSITDHWHIAVPFTVREQSLSVDEYTDKFLQDAVSKLANKVDLSLMGLYKNIGNSAGTPGTAISDYPVFGNVAAKLTSECAPLSNRTVVLNPKAYYAVVNKRMGLFNPDALGRGTIEGCGTVKVSNNVPVHTNGTMNTSCVVNGTVVDGSTVAVTSGTGTLVVGDSVSFEGCYKLNPVSYQSTGDLMEFTVTELLTNTGNLKISPAIVTTGPTRNVSNVPGNGKKVYVLSKTQGTAGTYDNNIAFHKKAICLATAKFNPPQTAVVKEQLSRNGVTMTLTGAWDGGNYRETYRLDVIWGVKVLRPGWAVRLVA